MNAICIYSNCLYPSEFLGDLRPQSPVQGSNKVSVNTAREPWCQYRNLKWVGRLLRCRDKCKSTFRQCVISTRRYICIHTYKYRCINTCIYIYTYLHMHGHICVYKRLYVPEDTQMLLTGLHAPVLKQCHPNASLNCPGMCLCFRSSAIQVADLEQCLSLMNLSLAPIC